MDKYHPQRLGPRSHGSLKTDTVTLDTCPAEAWGSDPPGLPLLPSGPQTTLLKW